MVKNSKFLITVLLADGQPQGSAKQLWLYQPYGMSAACPSGLLNSSHRFFFNCLFANLLQASTCCLYRMRTVVELFCIGFLVFCHILAIFVCAFPDWSHNSWQISNSLVGRLAKFNGIWWECFSPKWGIVVCDNYGKTAIYSDCKFCSETQRIRQIHVFISKRFWQKNQFWI